jgi:fumarate reductase (CoM/CoB) subunit A
LKEDTIQTDVLIIGGGGAGVRAALEADRQGVSVALINKGIISRSGLTVIAGGSFQVPFGHANPLDNAQVQFEDTVREGRGLGDENLIDILCREAVECVLDLEAYGVKFLKENGKFAQFMNPGQTWPRFVRVPGRGYHVMAVLQKQLLSRPSIRVFEDCVVTKILTAHDGRPAGAIGFMQQEGRLQTFQGKSVVLATGGYEELWEKSAAAPDSTGDGIALAYPLGAGFVDLEMMLCIPAIAIGSGLYPSMPLLLMYEFLLDPEHLGGKLLNTRGEEFVPSGKLPVRDEMIRLIIKEREEGRATKRGGVFIDLSKSPLSPKALEKKIELLGFRNQFLKFKALGIDLTKDPVEVAPACLNGLGGIRINERTETCIPGLFACGEVAGNIHGANRLSGNALTETQVFGRRAGRYAGEEAKRRPSFPALSAEAIAEEMRRLESFFKKKRDPVRPSAVRKKIKRIMEDRVGYIRDETGIRSAVAALQDIAEQDLPRMQVAEIRTFNYELQDAYEVHFMTRTAELVSRAALLREESRGHHFRADFPTEDPSWLRHTLLQWRDEGLFCGTAPVIRKEK